MKRLLGIVTLLGALASACSTVPTVSETGNAPGFLISDAEHGAGNSHFYFLAPMVDAPSPTGTFDGTQQPTVEICEWSGATCAAPPFVTYTTRPPDDDVTGDEDQGERPEYIKVSRKREWYRVRWHTDEYNLDPAKTYRIRVFVGAIELGYADVDVTLTRKEARNVNTGEYIPLVNGKTLPIKFRIEEGALSQPSSWSILPPMPTARQWVSVTSDADHLFALGGWNGANLSTNEAYDVTTNSWVTLASMPQPRYAGTGAQVIGGKIYVAGGELSYPATTNSLYIYDISSDSWSTGPNAPSGMGCGASSTIDGKLYAFSGCLTSWVYDSALFSFDPGTNQWETLPPAPHVHTYPGAVAVGGKLYVIGGFDNLANTVSGAVDVYDPTTATWSSSPPLHTARYSASAVAIGNKIYVFGGAAALDGPALSTVEVFDVPTQTWSAELSMPTARWDAGAALLGGRVIVVGGTASSSSWFNLAEAFQP